MTLADLRALVRVNILDRTARIFGSVEETNAAMDRYINQAMHMVAGLLAASQSNLAIGVFEGPIENQTADPFVLADMTGFLPVHRIISAWRTDDANSFSADNRALEVIDFKHVEHESKAAALAKPKVFVFNQTIGFVKPEETGFKARVWYDQALLDMTTDTDTPGQFGGNGIENALPETYHALIATQATLYVLAATNASTRQWEQIITEERGILGIGLQVRQVTQE